MLRSCVVDGNHLDDFRDLHLMRASGIQGAIFKATEGQTYVDPTYANRRVRALSVPGLLVGSYHFSRAGDGANQAAFYLDTAMPGPDELLCLDWEMHEKTHTFMSQASAEHFVQHVFDNTGKWPVLYSGQAFLGDHFNNSLSSPLASCSLWLARYGPQEPVVPAPWTDFDLWQYSESATVPGVANRCDCSHWNGAADELAAWWKA